MRKNKYNNRKVRADGKVFDSKKEFDRWCVLKLMMKSGEIEGLKHHELFTLLPPCKNYKRPLQYEADFTYYKSSENGGELIVEDVKGFRTNLYLVKRRMMSQLLGIEVKEV